MRTIRLLFVLGLVTFAVVPNLAAEPRRPNVVFILADDLGYTDLACYGSKFYETPQIDALAAGGLRFTSGYTCGPNCQPTRAALMSGQYGPRTGIYTVGSIDRFDWQSRSLRPVDNVTELPLDKVTLATSHETVEEWDSLNLLNILMAVEGEFGVSFSPEEAAEFASVEKIVAVVRSKGVS